MDIKREFFTACQLLGLLYLLVWSLTWNLPENFTLFGTTIHSRTPDDILKTTSKVNVELLLPKEIKHSMSIEYLGSIDQGEKQISNPEQSFMLPPFNIWKEIEQTKQERIEEQNKQLPTNAKQLRRKLNYSSSKCGAKILAANKEAKYRKAILNERIDEYMLNPCKAKSWFVIELCDNIEATQIEMANYELYSSTPKEFSVFWSDVYPTQTWHFLGTFEAKDQRTVQTFELSTRNMGKFMKVTVLNHHGKEHYCPLSVFRILGYSMLYEYENLEIEHEKSQSKDTGDGDASNEETDILLSIRNTTQQEIKVKERSGENKYNSTSNSFSARMCEVYWKYCSFSKCNKKKQSCYNNPYCDFLKTIREVNEDINICSNFCKKELVTKSKDKDETKRKSLIVNHDKFNSFVHTTTANHNNKRGEKSTLNDASNFVLSSLFRNKKHLSFLYWPNQFQFSNRETIKFEPVGEEKPGNVDEDNTSGKSENKTLFDVGTGTMNRKTTEQNKKITKQNADMSKEVVCDCNNNLKGSIHPKEQTDSFNLGVPEQENSHESAALIQKESVLVKLTARMKASETNLDFINRYLQKLSQSYKLQMEDMQNIFDATFNAMLLASEEANKINELQQATIELLQQHVQTLTYQTQYMSHVQENTFKKVLELHGFFLILEFIIISTIFNIFVNRFRLYKS